MAARGSIAAPTSRLLTRSSRTTWPRRSNAARTAASSPRAKRKQTLPGAASCSCGAPRAARRAIDDGGERLVVDLDQFGRILRLRRRVRDHGGDRLADMANRAARQRPARRFRHRRAVARRIAHSGRIGPMPSAAMSAPVNTATTPGMAAAAVSIPRMRAWACGERTSTQCNSPASSMSATKRPGREGNGGSSTRRTGAPMPW